MKVKIAKIAQQEFNEAKQFYEIEQTGLGSQFEKDIKTLSYVSNNPLLSGLLNGKKCVVT